MGTRIGMILDQRFPPDIRVENEAASLANAGYEIYLWCYTYSDEPLYEKYHGFHIIRNKISRFWMKKMRAMVSRFPIYTYYLYFKISRFIQKYEIEILHVHDLYLLGAGLKLKKKYGLKIVSDLHENYVEGLKQYTFANTFPGNVIISIKKWYMLEKRWLQQVDRIIVVVEEAINRVSQIGINRSKIYAVQNYLNYKIFESYGIKKGVIDKYIKEEFILSYIGDFDFHRGLHILIEGFAKFINHKSSPIKLLLIGNGRIFKDLKEMVRKLQIGEFVEFTGYEHYTKLGSYIAASDVCAIPHLKSVHTDNTLPHKLCQYMYMKKPVIVSDCDPLRRIVEECKCGLVYTNSNPDDLAEKLEWFYSNRNLLEKLGNSGNRCVVNKYNWQTAEKTLLELYEKI
ncbi:MAG: glycosyltransferase [Candidatus Lokiarchaeota archaeon]|nr:glycosyltransferase [Candidatus Lokiarchaeota archaeon]